jgi:hypothetical protein
MNPLLEISKVTSGAVTKNAVVVLAADATVLLPAAANAAKVAGVAGAAAASGAQCRVAVAGVVDVIAASAITPGDLVMVAGATGKVQTVLAVAGTVYNVVGVALEAAAADGDIFEILLAPCTRNSAAS